MRTYLYLAFALIVLIVQWESQLSNPVVASAAIPEKAIRLRILADSDQPEDQFIKRRVRDAVVEKTASWVQDPQDLAAARTAVREHLPEIRQVVESVLRTNGERYDYTARLGQVEFPAKMYGDRVYPAGTYEALLITLGRGNGQNWWCVLFPPLCFVDAAAGDAVAAAEPVPAQGGEQKKTAASGSGTQGVDAAQDSGATQKKEVRFFIWEVLQKVSGFLQSLFQ